ncbi:MAG: LysR family transcriptional regulator [Proteobacteria bacterium]|nr:LysR family transcriptional regulator [Pseudomonadota bacterium]
MDRAAEMEILVAAIDRGGFTAAADHLGLTPSAVSKVISRLEARLGVRLVERTTRRIALTAEGRTFYAAARGIIGAIDEAEASVMEARGRPQGVLRVNCGTAFAMIQLAPVLSDFMTAHPGVSLELGIEDRIADIVGEDIDVGIRTGPVGDDRLVARRFADVRRVIVASPAYLQRMGRPTQPDDLARHVCIPIATTPDMALWPFVSAAGPRFVEVRGPVRVGTAEGAHALALGGVGIARLGDLVVARSIREGALVPLLEDSHIAEPVPMHLVFPAGRQRLPKVRVFLDFVMDRFSRSPWRV